MSALLEALIARYDKPSEERLDLQIGTVMLTVVFDVERSVVITLWRTD